MSIKIDLYLIAFGTVIYLHEMEEYFYMNSKGWVVRLMEAVPTGPDLSEVPQVWANVYLYPAIHYPSIAEFSYEDIPFYESELMLGTSLVYMDQGGYRYVVLK